MDNSLNFVLFFLFFHKKKKIKNKILEFFVFLVFLVFLKMNSNPEVFVKEMKDVHKISVNAIQEMCNKTNETILKLYTTK